MKEDFRRNHNKKRDDSPLRWKATVHCTTTHDQRIRWLFMENRSMYIDLLSADLFVAVAKLKYNGKRKVATNLQEYKTIKEAEVLWKECVEEENNITTLEVQNWRRTEDKDS